MPQGPGPNTFSFEYDMSELKVMIQKIQLFLSKFPGQIGNTKLPEMPVLASNDFRAAKRELPTSGVQPDDHWIKSQVLIHLR